MTNFLIGLYFFYFTFLCFKRPVWALALIFAALPAYQIRFKIWFIPFTLLEGMIIILFLSWILRRESLKNIKEIIARLGNWKWLILFWLLAGTIAIFPSPNFEKALGVWKAYFLEPVLLFIAFLNLIETKRDFNLVLRGLIFSVFYLSLGAVGQKFFGGGVFSLETWGEAEVWRATSFFPQPNFLGLYLAPITILILGKILTRKIYQEKSVVLIFYFFTFLLSLVAIILARSEGALLGVFVGSAFIGLIVKSYRKFLLPTLVIFVIFLLIFPQLRFFLWQKLTFQDFSGQIRRKIWQETFSLLKAKPIFGSGLAGYQKSIEPYHEPYLSEKMKIPLEIHPYPHNLFLAIWSET